MELTNSEIKLRINAVINALNNMSITGLNNWQTMSGCLTMLQDIANATWVDSKSDQ